MIYGCVLLAAAALVVVAAVVCWLAGVQLAALMKIALTACAVLLTVAGLIVVSGDLLVSAGYFGSRRVEPNKPIPVKPPTTELPTDTVQDQLSWMHEHTVGVFIEGQGFGTGRMLPNFTDIISAPQTSSDNSARTQGLYGPYVREAGKGRVHNGVPNTDTNGYLWNGNLRSKDGVETWKVRTVYLVGLVKHPQPTVYLTDQTPDMKKTKEVPVRELDAFEKSALETLKGGENLVVEKHDETMRVLGPIYAGKNCVKCHDQKGQLLGAFTYQLELVPVPAQDKKSRELP